MCVHTCVQCAFGVNVSEYCAGSFVCNVKDGIDNLISFLLTVCDIYLFLVVVVSLFLLLLLLFVFFLY